MYSLLIDCSHKVNFIGLSNDMNNWIFKRNFHGQPFENLIENLKSALDDSSIDHSEISHFYTPDSPGSTLGIRVTQMMIQGLLNTCCLSAKVTHYNGLYLSALSLLEDTVDIAKNNYLITENGRHSWNVLKIDTSLKMKPEIHQSGLEDLSELQGYFYYIPQIKTWSDPKVDTNKLDYLPQRFLGSIKLISSLNIDTSLLSPTRNTYVKWNQG